MSDHLHSASEDDRLSRTEKVQKAIAFFRELRRRNPMPADFRFDREEANSREREV